MTKILSILSLLPGWNKSHQNTSIVGPTDQHTVKIALTHYIKTYKNNVLNLVKLIFLASIPAVITHILNKGN